MKNPIHFLLFILLFSIGYAGKSNSTFIFMIVFLFSTPSLYSQSDPIVFPIEKTSTIKLEDIDFYEQESDGVWRARKKYGDVLAIAEKKRFFNVTCFCMKWKMHGIALLFDEDGHVISISIYKNGNFIRSIYPEVKTYL